MNPKIISLAIILLSIVSLALVVGCTPREEEANAPEFITAHPEQSELLKPTSVSVPSETTTLMPDLFTTISVTVNDDNLELVNNSSVDVYFEAFPQEMLAFIEWAPCENPEKCQDKVVKPNNEVLIPLRKIADRETTMITVYWWSLEKAPNDELYEVTNFNSVDLNIEK